MPGQKENPVNGRGRLPRLTEITHTERVILRTLLDTAIEAVVKDGPAYKALKVLKHKI